MFRTWCIILLTITTACQLDYLVTLTPQSNLFFIDFPKGKQFKMLGTEHNFGNIMETALCLAV